MITYTSGDIFQSTASCLVNPVNCVGVMGKGLALEFKKRYPEMFMSYKDMCNGGNLSLGKIAFWRSKHPKPPIICLFPTKHHWRDRSYLTSIERGFESFIKYAPEMHITSAAFPQVGCGLGGLNFEAQVKPLFEQYFRTAPFQIDVYLG